MPVPALAVQIQGQGSVSADNLNTYEQTCDDFTQLRGFIGVTGVQVWVRGQSQVGDGAAGAFYWSGSSTAPDDNMNVIAPTGAGTTGRWVRDFMSPAFGPRQIAASAATVDLGSYPSNNIYITGNTTISSFGSSAAEGSPNYLLVFEQQLTITASSNIQTPGGGNFTTAAGSSVIMIYLGGGVWQLLAFSGGSASTGIVYFTVASGGPNVWTASIAPPFAFANGTLLLVQFSTTNTSPGPTLSVNSGPAIQIVDVNNTILLPDSELPLYALLQYTTSGDFLVLLNSTQQSPPASIPTAATDAEMEAGMSATTFATPANVWLHPALPKAWVIFNGQNVNGACAIVDSFNVSGVSRTSAGKYAVATTGITLTSGWALTNGNNDNSGGGSPGAIGMGQIISAGANPTANVSFGDAGGSGGELSDPSAALVVIFGKSSNA